MESQHATDKDVEEPSSLLGEYNLENNADGSGGTLYKHSDKNHNYLAKEAEVHFCVPYFFSFYFVVTHYK